MIRYSLKCKDGHGFESWFQSADAFDALAAKGMVTCAICGSDAVDKALMAPKVDTGTSLSEPASDAEAKLAEMRRTFEREATYVGGRFTDEARKLHETKVDKPIYGEANAQQIKGLLDDGVPIAPLPFLPKSKAN